MSDSRTGPVFRIAELEIDPGQLDRYKALLSVEIEAAVRTEPGVLFLHAVLLRGSSDKLRIFEGYADQAAYETHLTTPHFLEYKARTAGMVTALRLIETDPVMLRSKSG